MQLDSKHDLQDAMLNQKSEYQEKYMTMKQQYEATVLGIRQQAQDQKGEYQSGLLDAKTRSLDLQGQALSARQDASQSRIDLATTKLQNQQEAQGRNASDREDKQSDALLTKAQTEADKDVAAIGKITDADKKAAAYTRLGVDPSDPNADQMVQDAALQSHLADLPKKAKDYAYAQGVELAPLDARKRAT